MVARRALFGVCGFAFFTAFVIVGSGNASPVVGATRQQQRCSAASRDGVRAPAAVGELVFVKARSAAAETAQLSIWRRVGACLDEVGGPWPAFVGGGGLSSHRHEGDGTTPIGTFRVGSVMYGIDPDPGFHYHYHRIVCGDWWDEDPASSQYNQFVQLGCGETPPFSSDSEPLWTELPAYRYFAVIDFNTDPTVAGRGSGIFLHVSTGEPTNGCVGIAEDELVHFLRWLRPRDHPLVEIAA